MSEATTRDSFLLPADHGLRRLGRLGWIAGAVAAVLFAIGYAVDPRQASQAYLLGYLFWIGVPLGSLVILMLQHITGGAWGAVLRRILEASVRTFPLMALLFVPIALSLPELYTWANPETVAADPLLQHKQPYLNTDFFLGRAVFYFFVWIVLSYFLARWSRQRDGADPPSQRRLENLSRGGLLAVALTVTFASVDWGMSLEPHWFSTIYGILFVGGQVLTAFTFSIPVAASLSGRPVLRDSLTPDRFHDLGKLLLAFVMVWAYLELSQFLIIWSGNLPEETPWYYRRLQGGWQWVGISLIALHFALPFVLLLSRPLKRRAGALAAVACGVLFMRLVDVTWMISPAFERTVPGWLDVVAVAGTGGLWVGLFVWRLADQPLLPLSDPDLPEVEVPGIEVPEVASS